MSDNLENFIRNNRESFDDQEPSRKVWDVVKNNVPSKKKYVWLWKAAAIVFFLTSIFLYTTKSDGNLRLISQKEKISSDFKDIELFYFEMISEKRSLIQSYGEKTDLDYAYEQDLQNLDAMYEVLKAELKNNPSKKVVDALLLNLVVRIDILNKELAELDENTVEPESSDAAI